MQANIANERIAKQIIDIISDDYQNYPYITEIQALAILFPILAKYKLEVRINEA